MVYSFEYGRFTVLSLRDRGRARRAQSILLNRDTCDPTMEAEETYIVVAVHDHRLDEVVWQLTALFHRDLDEYIVQKDTLCTQEDREWKYVALFLELLLG